MKYECKCLINDNGESAAISFGHAGAGPIGGASPLKELTIIIRLARSISRVDIGLEVNENISMF